MRRNRLLAQVAGVFFGMTVLATPDIAAAAPPYSALFPGTGLVTLPGMTAAQRTMAQSIDNVCPSLTPRTDLANVCGAMIGSAVRLQGQANPLELPGIPGITSVQGLEDALTQLNGGAETLTPTNQASQLRNLQGSALASRLSILHLRMMGGAAAGDDSNLLALNDGPTANDTPGILLTQTAPTEVSFWHDKLGVFFNAIGQFGSGDTTSSQNGYDFYNAGFLVGADYRVMPQLTLGASLGYTHSNTDFATSAQSAPGQYLHGDLLEGSLYATWYATDALYVDAIGSIGGGGNDSQRVIALGAPIGTRTATGSFGTQTYGISLGGGYALPFGALTLTPTARMEYRRIQSDSFSENGANGLDLTYGRSSEDAVLSFAGGQVQYAISTDFGVVIPTGRFEWAHQYNNGVTAVGVAYSNDPTGLSAFTLTGDPMSRNYYDLGVGIAVQLANNWSGFVNYDSILGVSHTSFNSFTAGVRLSF